MDFGIWQAYGTFLNKNMMAVIIIELTFVPSRQII